MDHYSGTGSTMQQVCKESKMKAALFDQKVWLTQSCQKPSITLPRSAFVPSWVESWNYCGRKAASTNPEIHPQALSMQQSAFLNSSRFIRDSNELEKKKEPTQAKQDAVLIKVWNWNLPNQSSTFSTLLKALPHKCFSTSDLSLSCD